MATPKKKPTATAAKKAETKPAAAKTATKVTTKKSTPAKATEAPKKEVKAKAAATPVKPAATKKEVTAKPAAAAKKPATPKTATRIVDKPAPKPSAKGGDKKKPVGDRLTPEEKARVKKLRETLALLKADPEWPAFLQEQKLALLKLRDEMLPNMQNVTRDHLRSGASNVSSSSGQHIGDAGSEAEVRDLTIRLLDKDREQLFEIDAALERIRKGVYGICEISLDPIPKRRLQVRPFCRLTVKCQEEYEKKYGSYSAYRAKKQDHVGYADLQNDMENAISLDESEE